jgi:hypothetical protein
MAERLCRKSTTWGVSAPPPGVAALVREAGVK